MAKLHGLCRCWSFQNFRENKFTTRDDTVDYKGENLEKEDNNTGYLKHEVNEWNKRDNHGKSKMANFGFNCEECQGATSSSTTDGIDSELRLSGVSYKGINQNNIVFNEQNDVYPKGAMFYYNFNYKENTGINFIRKALDKFKYFDLPKITSAGIFATSSFLAASIYLFQALYSEELAFLELAIVASASFLSSSYVLKYSLRRKQMIKSINPHKISSSHSCSFCSSYSYRSISQKNTLIHKWLAIFLAFCSFISLFIDTYSLIQYLRYSHIRSSVPSNVNSQDALYSNTSIPNFAQPLVGINDTLISVPTSEGVYPTTGLSYSQSLYVSPDEYHQYLNLVYSRSMTFQAVFWEASVFIWSITWCVLAQKVLKDREVQRGCLRVMHSTYRGWGRDGVVPIHHSAIPICYSDSVYYIDHSYASPVVLVNHTGGKTDGNDYIGKRSDYKIHTSNRSRGTLNERIYQNVAQFDIAHPVIIGVPISSVDENYCDNNSRVD